MNTEDKLTLTGIIIAIIAVAVSFTAIAHGTVSIPTDTKQNSYEPYTFFSATTTTATSSNITNGGGYLVTAGAKKVEFYFTHGGTATTSTGTSTFSVQVSPDGTNWYDYNKLISNVANTISQTVTRVASVQIVGATSTSIVALDLSSDAFYAVRCIVREGTELPFTNGEHTCTAAAEF